MKQTAIQISMINNINNSDNNGEQLMTSQEIAALTGKKHCHVMEAIRKMELAWKKVNESNFRLVEYQDNKGELRPCYLLTKTECLYIATKFNDEARAKLVIRWEELERDVRCQMEEGRCKKPKEIRLLACDEEVLDEADNILGDELAELNRRGKYCYTATEIGKMFGMEGRDLNSFLADKGVIRWARGQWQLTRPYQHMGLTENRYRYVHGLNGRRKQESYLVWTDEGREFIKEMVY